MKGSIRRRCYCKGTDGKELGARCPRLSETKHGEYEYRDRHVTSTGVRPMRRGGFATRKAASEFRGRVYELLALAKDDTSALARLGDLVFEKTKRGGQLPAVDDVRRRLGIGHELDRSQSVADWLEQWLAGKRRLKESARRSYRQHIDHYLAPLLGHFPLDRLTAEAIADMLDLIEEWNAEIRTARDEGRPPSLAMDTRARPKVVGPATQRRVYATLRNALNAAWKARRVEHNVALFVELPAESREAARTWDPEQVGTFLASSEGDPLYLLFRLVLLHGPRRGEAVGARWTGYDQGTGELRVKRPLLQLGGRIVESTPKTRAGDRVLYLSGDDVMTEGIKRLRVQQARQRLALGEAYSDDDLIFCREDGTPYPPDYVSRRFRELAAEAGLPVIKLHEGRHTAATLRLEAGIDIKIVSEQMGHSTTTITRDLYQHVRKAVLDKTTEAVVRLLPERKKAEDTGPSAPGVRSVSETA